MHESVHESVHGLEHPRLHVWNALPPHTLVPSHALCSAGEGALHALWGAAAAK